MPATSSSSISMRFLSLVLSGLVFAGIACAQGPPPESVAPTPATGPSTNTVPAPASKDAPAAAPAPTPDAASNPKPASSPATPPASTPATTPAANEPADSADAAADTSVDPASLLPAVPSLPPQKASLIGGTVDKMDRVRDVLTVRVFGGGKMKIYFDPRTRILRNGDPALPSDLHRGDHVSIDTILNGGTIFARNIRLTSSMSGESQGIVVSYNGGSELELRDTLSPRVLKLRVTPQTRVIDHGHTASTSELVRGTLVAIKFGSSKDGHNVIEEVNVLAVPGRTFTFVGHVTNLDLHNGLIVLTSATDGKSYEIHYDPVALQVDEKLEKAADITVVTRYDGSHYVANSVKVN